MATELNLDFDKGSYFSKTIRVLNPDNSNYNLTGCTAAMQVRETFDSPDATLSLTSGAGNLIINTANSTIEIIIAPDAALVYKKYVYDLEVTDSSSKPTRVVQGVINVSPEVTR